MRTRIRSASLAGLAAPREAYNESPPALRRGDVEGPRRGTLEDIGEGFEKVAKALIALQGR